MAESNKPETPKESDTDAHEEKIEEVIETGAEEAGALEEPEEETAESESEEEQLVDAVSEETPADPDDVDAEEVEAVLEEETEDESPHDDVEDAETIAEDVEAAADDTSEETVDWSDESVEEEMASDEDLDAETEEIAEEDTDDQSEGSTDQSDDDRDNNDLAAAAVAGAAVATAASTPWDRSETEAEKTSQSAAQTQQTVASAQQPAPAPRRGGFFPMLLGGVIAAALGFVAGRSEVIDSFLPEALQQPTVDLAPLEEQIAASADANAAIEGRLDEMSGAMSGLQADLPTVRSEVTTLSDAVAGLQENANAEPDDAVLARIEELATAVAALQLTAVGDPNAAAGMSEITAAIDGLAARLDAVEAVASDDTPPENMATTEDVAGLQAEQSAQGETLDALRTQVDGLTEEARVADETARGEAQKVLARAALTQVTTAVDSGSPYATALSDLQEVTPVEVPEALGAAAEEGVVTLAELRDTYPDAARAALAAARAEIPESEVEGIGGFFRRQLSVRSVVPREGDDADAVLSRAEAAVNAGELETALTELEALSDAARAAMQEWLDSAEARYAVQEAAAGLAASLASN